MPLRDVVVVPTSTHPMSIQAVVRVSKKRREMRSSLRLGRRTHSRSGTLRDFGKLASGLL